MQRVGVELEFRYVRVLLTKNFRKTSADQQKEEK